ncbi:MULTISPECIES: monovalent cation/H+ antiporter complex subunit F [Thermomonosporaceae]|uniref:monovalent cation/H+ antiporter complex subunit F n=1 Tax=Thermomonosporaceae TaxID=2012 RepID=UPI00255A86BA|nr:MULTISPECIES: monovalent cation/H+ antiporter complex subunit F [Thermomonosporaceae]MDL4770573.1 monovalent cation/H+ antiporter complex subunit F [Actinomadura xylanilytica]
MTIVIAVATAALGVAAALTLARLVRGPTMLDRAVALDVLAAVIMAGLGVEAIAAEDPWVLPTLLALSLIGFVGSASIARFLVYRNEEDA